MLTTKKFIIRCALISTLFLPIDAFACPEGYAIVPQDNVYITEDYCLAVHEMKNVNNKAVSTAEGEIWHLAHYPAQE